MTMSVPLFSIYTKFSIFLNLTKNLYFFPKSLQKIKKKNILLVFFLFLFSCKPLTSVIFENEESMCLFKPTSAH